ncbi:MAG: LacI family DNA-binding transcriptional regulator, partial [Phycicoccus sp.]
MNVTPLSGSPRATMRDVAALAGVSVKTVSRVVNDEPGVSADVRDRVAAAVTRLDYRPNLAASNLRRTGARTGLIGALVQDISNSFSASVLHALEETARRHQTAVLAASLDERAGREHELVHDLVTRRVDGLVLMPASERQDYLVGELRTGTPA